MARQMHPVEDIFADDPLVSRRKVWATTKVSDISLWRHKRKVEIGSGRGIIVCLTAAKTARYVSVLLNERGRERRKKNYCSLF